MTPYHIIHIQDPARRSGIAADILRQLPDWFGLPESTANYISECASLPVWTAMAGEEPLGFISLKRTAPQASEIHCMGVLPGSHRQGIGRALLAAALKHCRAAGDILLQVKTVDQGHYPEYDRTIAFYEAMGFIRLEVFPELWDPWNPCLQLVLPIYAQDAGPPTSPSILHSAL